MSFSENIRLLRKQMGLTQKQLADNCGLSIATIQGYEQGKYEPKPEALLKLVKALNTTGSELMGYSLELIKPKNNLAEIAKHTISIDESNPAYKAVNLLIKEKQELYKALSELQGDNEQAILINMYHELNSSGQIKLLDYADDLTKIPEYRKVDTPEE